MRAFIISLMLTGLLVALVMCLTACQKRIYAGLEAQVHGEYEGKGWEHDCLIGNVGAEIDRWITDSFGVRGYIEHRSEPCTKSDGWGQNVGGGKLLYEF